MGHYSTAFLTGDQGVRLSEKKANTQRVITLNTHFSNYSFPIMSYADLFIGTNYYTTDAYWKKCHRL